MKDAWSELYCDVLKKGYNIRLIFINPLGMTLETYIKTESFNKPLEVPIARYHYSIRNKQLSYDSSPRFQK